MGMAKDNAAYRFAEMPDVDGAPIVESGSNSDGNWTRWADGTASYSILYAPGANDFSTATNDPNIYKTANKNCIYPITIYNSVPIISVGRYTDDILDVISGAVRSYNSNAVSIRLYSLNNSSSLGSAETIFVFGRWKVTS